MCRRRGFARLPRSRDCAHHSCNHPQRRAERSSGTRMRRCRDTPSLPPPVLLVVVLALIGAVGCAASTSVSSVHPSGAPSGESIAVSGPVPATLVSTDGPTTDGVFIGGSVAAVLRAIRLSGHNPCPIRQCWQGRQLPEGTVGIAFQANPLGCEWVDSLQVTSPQHGTIQVDVQEHPLCTKPGSGAAAKGRQILVAIPRSALPATGSITAQVNLSLRPGDPFSSLGTASTAL